MVNRMCGVFPKGGLSAILTELNVIQTYTSQNKNAAIFDYFMIVTLMYFIQKQSAKWNSISISH